MTRTLRLVFPPISIGLLAGGYLLEGLNNPAWGLLVFGVFWMIGLILQWKWIPFMGLFAVFTAASIGLYLGPFSLHKISLAVSDPIFFGLGRQYWIEIGFSLAALFTFLAWDLDDFHQRLSQAAHDDNLIGIERKHLLTILSVVLTGAGLSIFAITLRVKLAFEWMVVLVIFVVWGIGRIVNWLLKKST